MLLYADVLQLTMCVLSYVGIGSPRSSSLCVPSIESCHSPIEKSCMISRAKFSSGAEPELASDLEPRKVRYLPIIGE